MCSVRGPGFDSRSLHSFLQNVFESLLGPYDEVACNQVKLTMFADDCVIYYSGNTRPNVKCIVQSHFDKIVHWTYRNNLRLN